MKMFVRVLFSIATLGLLWVPDLSAATLFSNLGQETLGGTFWSDARFHLATGFLTGDSITTITGATLSLANIDYIDHTFTVSIYSDRGSGTPGGLIGSLNVFTVPAGNGNFSYGNYSTTSAGIGLGANTSYWVVLQLNQASDLDVSWSRTYSDSTDAGSVFSTANRVKVSRDGTTWNDADVTASVKFQFSLEGEVVPEPATLALVVVGLLGFCLLRWRKV